MTVQFWQFKENGLLVGIITHIQMIFFFNFRFYWMVGQTKIIIRPPMKDLVSMNIIFYDFTSFFYVFIVSFLYLYKINYIPFLCRFVFILIMLSFNIGALNPETFRIGALDPITFNMGAFNTRTFNIGALNPGIFKHRNSQSRKF